MPNSTVMVPIRPALERPAVSVEPPTRDLASLTVLEGELVGQSFLLGAHRRTHLLGRSARSAVPLDHGSVSRRHARVFFSPDAAGTGWVARAADLSSTNGTWLNGERIHDATLKSGDELLIGRFRLGFELFSGSSAEPVPSSPSPRAPHLPPHVARRMDLRFRELTVIANRMRLDAGRYCVGVMHIDHLGSLRRALGEGVGTRLLEAAASAAARSLRACDVVARSHSDEVLLLLECAHLQGGHRAAARSLENVRHAAQAVSRLMGEKRALDVTASIGLALSGREPFPSSVQRARDALATALAVGGSSVAADHQVMYVH